TTAQHNTPPHLSHLSNLPSHPIPSTTSLLFFLRSSVLQYHWYEHFPAFRQARFQVDRPQQQQQHPCEMVTMAQCQVVLGLLTFVTALPNVRAVALKGRSDLVFFHREDQVTAASGLRQLDYYDIRCSNYDRNGHRRLSITQVLFGGDGGDEDLYNEACDQGRVQRRMQVDSETDPWCSNDLSGIDSDNGKYCCSNECSACGGFGCRDFGPTCCTSEIAATGRICTKTKEAPCMIDSGSPTPTAPTPTAPTPTTPSPKPETGSTCSNGLPGVDSDNGNYCCLDECSACGGSGCGDFGPSCCISDIQETGRICSETGEAPCFIDGDSPTPTAPTPTAPTPTTLTPTALTPTTLTPTAPTPTTPTPTAPTPTTPTPTAPTPTTPTPTAPTPTTPTPTAPTPTTPTPTAPTPTTPTPTALTPTTPTPTAPTPTTPTPTA
ncbi:unnamed protein product, partial [Ascophyllum nodosum]